jgi:hypothetical protein
MTQALIKQTPVTAPTRQSVPGSILDCATVIDTDNLWSNFADGMWTSASCGINHIIAKPLCDDTGYTNANKTFDMSPGWNTGHHFALYRTLRCNAVGLTLGEAELVTAFNAAEGLSVATAIANIYSADADAAPVPTGTSAACNFGGLVDYVFANYGAAPIFLLPASQAIALQASHVLDDRLQWAGGGCVAIGSGLTDAFAFGSMVIMRTPLIVQTIVNPSDNQVSLLVERMYEVGVDCDFVAKAPAEFNCGATP